MNSIGGFIEDLCFKLGLLVTTRVSTRDKRKARPQRPSRPNSNRCPPSRGKLASGVCQSKYSLRIGMGRYGSVFLLHLQGGEFQRPWKRCSMVANQGLEIEIAMGTVPMPISVSSPCFALRYEVPKFLAAPPPPPLRRRARA